MSALFKKLLPTFNRILVKKVEFQAKTSSGILLSQQPDTNQVAEVVAVGPGKNQKNHQILGNFDNAGKRVPLQVNVGETVLLPDFAGTEIKLNNEKYFVYRDSDVIGKLEK